MNYQTNFNGYEVGHPEVPVVTEYIEGNEVVMIDASSGEELERRKDDHDD